MLRLTSHTHPGRRSDLQQVEVVASTMRAVSAHFQEYEEACRARLETATPPRETKASGHLVNSIGGNLSSTRYLGPTIANAKRNEHDGRRKHIQIIYEMQ